MPSAKNPPAQRKAPAKKKGGQPKTKVASQSKPIGRPTKYTPQLAAEICTQLALGDSMRTVCKSPKMPAMGTVFRWLAEKPEFQEQYARAKEEACDVLVEDMLDIADNSTNDYMLKQSKSGEEYEAINPEAIQRSKLRVDTRKWIVSKLKPKKYGDFTRTEVTGKDGGAIEQSVTVSEISPDDDFKTAVRKFRDFMGTAMLLPETKPE